MTIIVFVLFAVDVHAGQYEHARSLALARSFTSLARGYQTIGINPANLALPGNNNYSIGLCAVGANLANNSFTLADYNKYNGAYLSQSDKDNLLAGIPDEGLSGNASGVASIGSFSIGHFAFGVTGDGAGRVTLPKDAVDLMLNGNTMDHTVELSDVAGNGVARAEANLSYARSLYAASWGDLCGGLTVKYIRGLGYYRIDESQIYLSTAETGITSQGIMEVTSSEGGSGLGIDVGVATVYNSKYTISVVITNLVSRIWWNKNNQSNSYSFTADSLTLDNVDDDSASTSEHISQPIGSFAGSLAPQVAVGVSTQYKWLTVSADLKQGLRNIGGISTTPQLALGFECSLLRFLPLRVGAAVGGAEKSSSGAGFGLVLGPFELDLGYAVSKSLIPIGGSGVGVALATGLRF
jgi:hypothetical protein